MIKRTQCKMDICAQKMTDSKVNDGRVQLRSRISDIFSTLEVKRSFRVDTRKTDHSFEEFV